ncbi:bacteriophage T4 gp5 trimerisation domain-containing protein [Vibrio metschnikovii]|uniref:bacteriophage T4 gp5 trimerisation domain-containing protein n=1 Tax=Vibrio metschnikovii TaxID=28172 RepID=UPI0039F17C04
MNTSCRIKTHQGEGFKEIRFEDQAGQEEIFIHAQKDQNNVVNNDETTKVGHDRSENVGYDETITIGNNRTETVGNNEAITIGNDRTETVGGNEVRMIKGNTAETMQCYSAATFNCCYLPLRAF